jgi:hypothetical protein
MIDPQTLDLSDWSLAAEQQRQSILVAVSGDASTRRPGYHPGVVRRKEVVPPRPIEPGDVVTAYSEVLREWMTAGQTPTLRAGTSDISYLGSGVGIATNDLVSDHQPLAHLRSVDIMDIESLDGAYLPARRCRTWK